MKKRATLKNIPLIALIALMSFSMIFITGCGDDDSPTGIETPPDTNLNWTAKNGSPGDNVLHAVFFVDVNNGWAVGDYGTILHYHGDTDTWKIQTSGTTASLRGVHFTDVNNGYVVGVDGIYLTTTDGGATWSSDNRYIVCNAGDVFVEVDLNSIYFFNSTEGWVTGDEGTIFKYATDSSCTDIVINLDTAITVINETAYDSTFDTLITAVDTIYDSIWNPFPDNLEITEIIDTTFQFDTLLTNPYPYSYDDSAITLIDTTFLTSQSGLFIMRENLFADMWDVNFFSATHGMAVGGLGTVVVTTDGGKNWSKVETGTSITLRSIKQVSATTAFVAGHNGLIMKTSDGGKSWVKQLSGSSISHHFLAIDFSDMSNGCAVNSNGDVYRTVNGGNSWKIDLKGTSRALNDVNLIDSENGWVVGFDGSIILGEM